VTQSPLKQLQLGAPVIRNRGWPTRLFIDVDVDKLACGAGKLRGGGSLIGEDAHLVGHRRSTNIHHRQARFNLLGISQAAMKATLGLGNDPNKRAVAQLETALVDEEMVHNYPARKVSKQPRKGEEVGPAMGQTLSPVSKYE